MTHTQLVTLRIPADLHQGLLKVKADVGIPVSEQIRRALRLWLYDMEDGKPAVRKPRKVRQ